MLRVQTVGQRVTGVTKRTANLSDISVLMGNVFSAEKLRPPCVVGGRGSCALASKFTEGYKL